MDKDICKAVLRDAGIADGALGDAADAAATRDDRSGRRVARAGLPRLREARQAGLERRHQQGARRADELAAALELAFEHDPKVLVEELLDGPRGRVRRARRTSELEASAVGEILPDAEWYDYDAKYDEGGMDIVVPADLDPADRRGASARRRSRAFRACECSGMARVDFFLRAGRRAWC